MSKEAVIVGCPACNATGDCPTCQGEGVLWIEGYDGAERCKRCADCDGSGCCSVCDGVGWTKLKSEGRE
jgi:hypothetical protein